MKDPYSETWFRPTSPDWEVPNKESLNGSENEESSVEEGSDEEKADQSIDQI